jgi:rubredoxin
MAGGEKKVPTYWECSPCELSRSHFKTRLSTRSAQAR